MRCAQHVASLDAYVHVWDVCLLLEKLKGHGLAAMTDPKKATGLIKPCSSGSNKEDALSKLNTAAARARRALDAYNAENFDDAFEAIDLLFNGKFPARNY